MRVAVTTPTGNVGRHLVPMLLRAGIRPLLLTRHPDRLAPELLAETDVATVDQRDPDAVVAATAGVDALFWVDPPSAGEDPLGDYARATESVVAAVRANGIGHTVFQSSVGAEKRHGAGEIDGLAHTEQALDSLVGPEVAVTHLRCGFFFSNLLLQLDAIRAGEIPVVLPLDQPMAWVAPRDIAEVAATRLVNPQWSGRCVQAVHGPVDLTWPEAASIISTVLGRPVRVRRVGDDVMRELLLGSGMTPGLADAVLGMSTGLRSGFVPEQGRSIFSTTGSSLAGWVYEVLLPLL